MPRPFQGAKTAAAGLGGAAAAAFPLLLLSRLPLLVRSAAALDGDESVLGLMALHLSEGGGLPVFFYGQSYGLSAVEAGAGALAFALLGPSAAALRAATLVLWSLGGLFLVLAAGRAAGRAGAWIALGLLAACPAWFEWALKARGGYVTAFLFSTVLLWLLVRPASRWGWTLLGACWGVVLLSQALWAACLAPLVLARWWERRERFAAGTAVAGALGVVLLAALGSDGASYWSPGLTAGLDPLEALQRLPGRLLTALHGGYLYEETLPVGLFSRLAGMAWALALAGMVGAHAVRVATGTERRRQGASLVALLGPLAFSLLIGVPAFGFRYLLPLPILLAFLLARENSAGKGRVAGLAAVLLIAAGGLALGERTLRPLLAPPGHPYALTAAEEEALVRGLEGNGMRHVYSLDPLLPWNLQFASREAIAARWLSLEDRLPETVRRVEEARLSGGRLALIGRTYQGDYLGARVREAGLDAPDTVQVTPEVFVVPDPGDPLLRALGFRLRGGKERSR
jgi:hypothetical protein